MNTSILYLVLTFALFSQNLTKSDSVNFVKILEDLSIVIHKDEAKALELIETAKLINSVSPEPYIYRGLLYFNKENIEGSYKEFLRAIKLSDKVTKKIYIQMINQLTGTFKSQEESDFYDEGYSFIEKRKPTKAVDIFLKAIKLNSFNYKLFFELGYAYIDTGDFKKAIYYLEKSRTINPVNHQTIKELRYCYAEIKRIDLTQSLILDEILIYGENPASYHELGYAQYASENIKDAIFTLEKNIEQFPSFYNSYYSLGQLYYREKMKDKRALFLLSQFIKLQREDTKEPTIKGSSISEIIVNAKKMIKELK